MEHNKDVIKTVQPSPIFPLDSVILYHRLINICAEDAHSLSSTLLILGTALHDPLNLQSLFHPAHNPLLYPSFQNPLHHSACPSSISNIHLVHFCQRANQLQHFYYPYIIFTAASQHATLTAEQMLSAVLDTAIAIAEPQGLCSVTTDR